MPTHSEVPITSQVPTAIAATAATILIGGAALILQSHAAESAAQTATPKAIAGLAVTAAEPSSNWRQPSGHFAAGASALTVCAVGRYRAIRAVVIAAVPCSARSLTSF